MKELLVTLLVVLCGVGLVPLEVRRGVATAASGYTRMPDPGVLAVRRVIDCDGASIEFRFYDFSPADDNAWKSFGVALPKEPNFVLVVFLPERTFDLATTKVYVDANRNGWTEEVIPFWDAYARWEGSWCVAYEQVRKGKP